MEIDPQKPNFKYKKLINAVWIPPDENILNVEVFDSENLNPVPKNRHFSPFIATAFLPRNPELYMRHRAIRQDAITSLWPQIEQLVIHLQRKQWHLFDNIYKSLGHEDALKSRHERVKATYRIFEEYSRFFRPLGEAPCQRIRQRIALAESSCPLGIKELIAYFRQKSKDEAIDYQLHSLRKQWTRVYSILATVYVSLYWDGSKNTLTDYTLAQKRFEELKSHYVDCYETFCRISVIAAGIEAIVFVNKAAVMKSDGIMSLEDYDTMNNGLKPDILKNLVISDLFVPYMDHKLRNGIGHNSAKYEVLKDNIEYINENKKGIQKFTIPYILFCEKVMKLYGQLELVSLYSNWLRLVSLGIK